MLGRAEAQSEMALRGQKTDARKGKREEREEIHCQKACRVMLEYLLSQCWSCVL